MEDAKDMEFLKSPQVTLLLKFGRHGDKGEKDELSVNDKRPFEIGQSLGADTKSYSSIAPRAVQTAEQVSRGAETSYQNRERSELITSKLLPLQFIQELRNDYDHGFDIILNNPEACALTACGIAKQIDHFRKMAERLRESTSKNLLHVTHDLELTAFLKEALIRHENGKEIHGFNDVNEIGGPFDTNEYFEVKIVKNAQGQESISFKFDNPERLTGIKCELDLDRISELSQFYKEELPSA